MRCATCGSDNPEHFDFCTQCSASLGNRCADCGSPNPSQARFCGGCGARLSSRPSAQAQLAPAVAGARGTEGTGEGRAERRQLTVLFCDLVGSTSLSERLDPEELRQLVRAYQGVCSDVVQRNEGHIAQYLGDGVLIYFGYPVAHEDDARRAVRGALAILAGVKELSKGLQQGRDLQLSVRMCVHTGQVVVGEVGGGEWRAQLALGEAPNLAARAQNLADPDTILVTAATYQLVEPFFTWEDLGPRKIKGLGRPVTLYRVVGETGARTRMQAAATLGMSPLVGRDQECRFLLECWERAKGGNAQAVLVRGEPGIGKSRSVEELKERLAGEEYLLLECYCSPYQKNTAFAPISDLLGRALGIVPEDFPREKLSKLTAAMVGLGFVAKDVVPLLAPLLSVPSEADYPPLDLAPLRLRQLTLEALTSWLLWNTKQRPLLVVVEDLHWADPSTLELLGLVMSQQRRHRMMMFLSFRSEFSTLWPMHEGVHEMAFTRLSREQTAALASHVAQNRTLPAEVLEEVVNRTDGVPLFVEELTKMLLESGFLKRVNGSYELTGPLPPRDIPATVQDSLMARLDSLGSAKTLAQLGATLGREFRHDVLQAVAQMDEADLQRDLARLVDADLLTRSGLPPRATYMFKHALIEDTAYQSLLKSTRQQYHQRIAGVLVARFPEVAETQPELLARHFTAAGLNREAIGYWEKAGQVAMERSANLEAIHHFRKGLELLASLPETPERIQQELMLQLHVGLPLTAIKGYGAADVGDTFARARELCELIGGAPQLAPVLYGLWAYLTRCEWKATQEMADQLLAMGEQQRDKDLLLEAHTAQGVTAVWVGPDWPAARAHLEQAVSLYDLQQHYSHALIYSQDPGVVSLEYLAWALWNLGYPEQAFRRLDELRKVAKDRAHSYSTAYSYGCEAPLWQMARCVREAKEVAEQGIAFTVEKGFPLWACVSTYVRCWVMAQEGQGQEAVAQFRQTLEGWRKTGALVSQPYQVGVFADTLKYLGEFKKALDEADNALALVDQYKEYWYQPELYRLRGDLLLLQERPDEKQAEDCFLQSLEIARRQSAKSWELRTSVSLARLWRRQDKTDQARQLLAECYGWFTEGFETPDLQEARTLLDELGCK